MITPAQYFTSRDPLAFFKWQQAVIGIAGAGGLGSNIAIALARAGVSRLIIADYDTLSLDNLNRQQYTLKQVGQLKVNALAENIHQFNPFISLEMHSERITPANLERIFGQADLLLEAFDQASEKEMLITAWQQLFPNKPIIAASGISGYGHSQDITIVQSGSLYVVGDQESELQPGISPISARVALVANLQADLALELIARQEDSGWNS